MPTQSDVRFAQAAVNAKFVDVERAKEALRSLKQAEAIGVTGSISDVFVKKGYLTKEQESQLLKALGLDKDAAKDIKKIGDFELLRRIGAGGMGAVYLAKHANGVEVALKVLPAHLASDEDYVARFQREASIAYQPRGQVHLPGRAGDRCAGVLHREVRGDEGGVRRVCGLVEEGGGEGTRG